MFRGGPSDVGLSDGIRVILNRLFRGQIHKSTGAPPEKPEIIRAGFRPDLDQAFNNI